MEQSGELENFEPKYRIDEEYEYYTELATNASQLWIESILRKRLPHQDDFRKSLEDGIILCELLNTLRPGCIKKINRLSSKIAGIDNLTIFLQTCSDVFSLHEKQLFQVSDLEDLTERAIPANQLADEQGKRIRRVLTTIFHLGKSATGLYDGSPIDFSAFTGIVTACPPPVATTTTSYNLPSNGSNGVHADDKNNGNFRNDADSPITAKASSAPSTGRQQRTIDHSPSRLSDAGSFDSSSNLSSGPGTQQKEGNAQYMASRSSQARVPQSHHFVKSGFSLPTGGSNLTKTAVAQMRMISESRQSGSFQAPVARQSSLSTNVGDDDAWQSDLDMWRNKRKQSLQTTLPAEVLQSVGLLEGDVVQDQVQSKKSNKKPGLLSKLRYSVDLDSEDPLVVNLEDHEKDALGSFTSGMKEQLPPIPDSRDSFDGHERNGTHKEESNNGDHGNGKLLSEENNGFKDLTFKISQQPGNLRGFGFSIKGGRDAQLPLTVDRVTAGSAADEADILADDEILKINNEAVHSYFRPTLNRLIQQCVKAGQITLLVRRYAHPQQQMQPPSSDLTSKSLPVTRSNDRPVKTVGATPLSNAAINGRNAQKAQDTVDSGVEMRMSPRMGPGPLVMEQEIKVRSPAPPGENTAVPPPVDESDQWLRSQALGNAVKQPPFSSSPGSNNGVIVSSSNQQQQSRPQLQASSSPTLSSSSSSSGGQRFIAGIPRSYPGQQQALTSSSGSSIKDDSQSSSIIQEDYRSSASDSSSNFPGLTIVPRSSNGNGGQGRSTGGSTGAILVRGGSQTSSLSAAENNNGVVSRSSAVKPDQSPTMSGGNVIARSPYYQQQQQQPAPNQQQSMIPQPWAPNNNNGSSNSLNTTPKLQPSSENNSYSGSRNGSFGKSEGGSILQQQQQQEQPETPPQLPRSVSSRELCAACSQSLGAGPAMAIERLGLFYHVRCFRCSVCKISLSNGQTGVDVRVKGARLHCQNCNSSDESGLQSSQV